MFFFSRGWLFFCLFTLRLKCTHESKKLSKSVFFLVCLQNWLTKTIHIKAINDTWLDFSSLTVRVCVWIGVLAVYAFIRIRNEYYAHKLDQLFFMENKCDTESTNYASNIYLTVQLNKKYIRYILCTSLSYCDNKMCNYFHI